jgi:hypothetical protein
MAFGRTTAQRAGLNSMHSIVGRMLFATALLIASSLPRMSAAKAQAVLSELLKPMAGPLVPSKNRPHLRPAQKAMRYVELNTSLLSFEVAEQINAHHTQHLILNISDRDRYVVELNEADISSPDQYVIRGKIEDVPEGWFLAFSYSRVFTISAYIGPRLVEIKSHSGDVYALIDHGLEIGSQAIAEQGSEPVDENPENLEHMNEAQLRGLIKRAQQALHERSAKRLGEIRQLAKEAGYEVTLRKIGAKEGRRPQRCHHGRHG